MTGTGGTTSTSAGTNGAGATTGFTIATGIAGVGGAGARTVVTYDNGTKPLSLSPLVPNYNHSTSGFATSMEASRKITTSTVNTTCENKSFSLIEIANSFRFYVASRFVIVRKKQTTSRRLGKS